MISNGKIFLNESYILIVSLCLLRDVEEVSCKKVQTIEWQYTIQFILKKAQVIENNQINGMNTYVKTENIVNQ